MSEHIEIIRNACLSGEIDTILGERGFNPHFHEDAQAVRRGEAVPIALMDVYPDKLHEVGFDWDETTEASLIFNAGRLRLATARLRRSRGMNEDYLPQEEDYLALASDINDIVRIGAREVLRLGDVRVSTTVPLVIGPRYVKEFYAQTDIGAVRYTKGGKRSRAFVDDLYTYTKIARGLQTES